MEIPTLPEDYKLAKTIDTNTGTDENIVVLGIIAGVALILFVLGALFFPLNGFLGGDILTNFVVILGIFMLAYVLLLCREFGREGTMKLVGADDADTKFNGLFPHAWTCSDCLVKSKFIYVLISPFLCGGIILALFLSLSVNAWSFWLFYILFIAFVADSTEDIYLLIKILPMPKDSMMNWTNGVLRVYTKMDEEEASAVQE